MASSSSVKTIRPSVSTVSLDSGLYGSTTAGETNTFTPNAFQQNLVNMTEQGILDYTDYLINPTYDNPVFQAQMDNLTQQADQTFENNIISPLAERGLTRGSNINQLSAQHDQNLIKAEQNLMANESSRVADILRQLASMYQMPYNMLTGLYNQNQNQQQANTATLNGPSITTTTNASKNDRLWQAVGTVGGAVLGSALGGPVGGAVGSQVGSSLASQVTGGSSGSSSGGLSQKEGIGIGAILGNAVGGLISDARLKENLKLLDTVEGVHIYLFDYIFGPKNQVGVIAQEILDAHPQAVGLNEAGYYYVIYPMLPAPVFNRIVALRKELNEGE